MVVELIIDKEDFVLLLMIIDNQYRLGVAHISMLKALKIQFFSF
jgi:hypothetical protein